MSHSPDSHSSGDHNADYYDAYPARIPKSPITIAGFHGTKHEHVARMVAAFSSLPILHASELIVHDTGKSGTRVLQEDGPLSYEAAVHRALDRALRSTTFGLVILEASKLTLRGVADRV